MPASPWKSMLLVAVVLSGCLQDGGPSTENLAEPRGDWRAYEANVSFEEGEEHALSVASARGEAGSMSLVFYGFTVLGALVPQPEWVESVTVDAETRAVVVDAKARETNVMSGPKTPRFHVTIGDLPAGTYDVTMNVRDESCHPCRTRNESTLTARVEVH